MADDTTKYDPATDADKPVVGETLAAAVQAVKNNLADVAISGNYSDLDGTPSLSAVATSGSYGDLQNRPNLATVATSGKYTDLTDKPELAAVALSGAYNDLVGKPSLATVATSGSYNDLTDKPSTSGFVTAQDLADAIELVDDELERNRALSNNVYPGRRIKDIPEIADEVATYDNEYMFLHARVVAQNWTGLRIGDYFAVPNTSVGEKLYAIMAFDHYYNCADQAIGHHLVCGCIQSFTLPSSSSYYSSGYIKWNTTSTNNGTSAEANPYLASNLHAWEINELLPGYPSDLQGILLNHRALAESRYSASATLTDSTSWSWKDLGKVWSPSEVEVYGYVAWGTPGWSQGMESQFPFFRETKNRIYTDGGPSGGTRQAWWLRVAGSASSTGACGVGSLGYAINTDATRSLRPRPCFLLG